MRCLARSGADPGTGPGGSLAMPSTTDLALERARCPRNGVPRPDRRSTGGPAGRSRRAARVPGRRASGDRRRPGRDARTAGRRRRPRARGDGRAALLRLRHRSGASRRPRRRLAHERLGPERRDVRHVARGGRGGGDRRGLARRPVRPARRNVGRVHDGGDDGQLHGARRRPPPGARRCRLVGRGPGPVRSAGDQRGGRGGVPRDDPRRPPDARARP